MNSTATQRIQYDPPCKRDHDVKAWYQAIDNILRKYEYGPKEGQTWGYNCRRITGGSGYSLHAFGGKGTFTFWNGTVVGMAIAVDINSLANPYGSKLITDMSRNMIEEILAIRTNSGKQAVGWGGNYRGNKDAMHFEVVCDLADLKTGIKLINFPTEEDDVTVDELNEALRPIHERLIGIEKAVFDPDETVLERSRQTLRLARGPAAADVIKRAEFLGVDLETPEETTLQRADRIAGEIENGRSWDSINRSLEHIAKQQGNK